MVPRMRGRGRAEEGGGEWEEGDRGSDRREGGIGSVRWHDSLMSDNDEIQMDQRGASVI
jgi:hypothetical protein